MMTNKRFLFGDIVLLKFPFTNHQKYKKRPALVIQDSLDGDIIVCRITSQLYQTRNDVVVPDWMKSGLKLPSIIRVHKIATLSADMVDKKLGSIEEGTMHEIDNILCSLTQH